MSEPLVHRLVAALGPGLTRSRTPDADWVVRGAPPPTAPRDVSALRPAGHLLHVVVTDEALAGALAEALPPVVTKEPAPDVPTALARATRGSWSRFAARRLDNPAYAALVVRDRAARGLPISCGRPLLVALADLPRVLDEADAGREHRLVEWLGDVAAQALRPDGGPLRGCPDVAPRCAATMTLALRRLGVPDIERL